MLINRKKILLAGNDNMRLVVALVFVICASFTALVHGATRSVENLDIDTVVLRGSSELKISFEDDNKLRVQGKENELDKQPFYVRGKTLYLGYSENGKHARNVKYKLSVETLHRIELQGSGTIWVDPVIADELKVALEGSGDIRLHSVEADRLKVFVAGSGNVQLAKADTKELSVELAGSGDIDLGDITTDEMNVDMSGSGDIVASGSGTANDLDIGLAGSGDVDLEVIEAKRADVGIAGSGDVSVWAVEDLNASIIGSGDVSYRGDPDVDSSVMGSGDVERAD
jgi:hypothetical protein